MYPQVPSPEKPHWGARYGMTTVVFPELSPVKGNIFTNSSVIKVIHIIFKGQSNSGTVFLMGGDTYNEIPQYIPQGLLDLSWSNGFKNDVWKMTGTNWMVSLINREFTFFD